MDLQAKFKSNLPNSRTNLSETSDQSIDEVDFIPNFDNINNNNHINKNNNNNNNNNNIESNLLKLNDKTLLKNENIVNDSNHNRVLLVQKPELTEQIKKITSQATGTLYGDCEPINRNTLKSSISSLEKFSFFSTKKNRQLNQHSTNTKKSLVKLQPEPNKILDSKLDTKKLLPSNEQQFKSNRFTKSTTLAKLLSNTYNMKKTENEFLKFKNNNANDNNGQLRKTMNSNYLNGFQNGNNGNNNVRKYRERFQKCINLDDLEQNNVSNSNEINCSKQNYDNNNFKCDEKVNYEDFQENDDLISNKTIRTISRSLGKLWWKRTHSVDISLPDPEYKVSYLGNVLTGWAKGEGCVEKPLFTLWRNYTQNNKPDVVMRIKVCASGLKATTRQHGLTEYWSNRITYCCAPKNYPKVFCWIYRHEGRKLKHELRCHAVLCNKEAVAQDVCNMLRKNLESALRDFKKEKILKQNARLSLVNSVYDNPSLPRRKILLSVGGNNYRPPMERSKSAPKLMAIEEAIGEEEGDEIEQTNEPEMLPCCQKDSLYPAMTLGRRRCRKGHSIRRTGKGILKNPLGYNTISGTTAKEMTKDLMKTRLVQNSAELNATRKSSSSLVGSDEEDFEEFLNCNNYDSESPLSNELLSYFDMKLLSKTSSLTNLHEDNYAEQLENVCDQTVVQDLKPTCSLSLDNLNDCAEDDYTQNGDCYHYPFDTEDEMFYQQSTILSLLHRNNSLRKLANLSISSDDSNCSNIARIGNYNAYNPKDSTRKCEHNHLDSDESSISSGCETASTVTTNMDDSSLKYPGTSYLADSKRSPLFFKNLVYHQRSISNPINEMDEIKTNSKSNVSVNSNQHAYRSSSSSSSNSTIVEAQNQNCQTGNQNDDKRASEEISDSEYSDESGYVEFQEQKHRSQRQPQKTYNANSIAA